IFGSFDLSARGLPSCELFTSTAPCAMCLGAIPWSGVKRVVCGAADEDARAIGFDEGAKVDNWTEELQKRGIKVVTGFMRAEASAVLKNYKKAGGTIYNSDIASRLE
ncbi:MAG: nucleoside deaminase, partial [Fibrobacter sp.]|nr:nucleoside deaminase [Fibrobacter sp.]